MSRHTDGGATIALRSDDGSLIEIYDVTGGRNASFVDAMCDLHCRSFPEHIFAADGIRFDARENPLREGIIVHQWLLTVNGHPTAYSLADTNLVRRTVPIHFLAVAEASRTITVEGERLGTWFLRDSLRQYLDDTGEQGLGACAETPDYKLSIFLPNGWRLLPVTYLEPIHGSTWRTNGLDTREVALIWLPPPGVQVESIPSIEPTVMGPAAASFLIDMYDLDGTIPWVAALCGATLGGPRPNRQQSRRISL